MVAAWLLLVFAAATVQAADKPDTVSMVVDYGDGVQVHFTALPWQDSMTVLDAIDAAAKHPHGVKFEKRGRGTATLVTGIGKLKNEGSGKNWLYSVNKKDADVGVGAYRLEPGDAILWEFKAYDYNR